MKNCTLRPFYLAIAAAWLILLATPIAANVSQKNGNFYIGYSDVSHGGTQTLKLERVYNSKTPFKGIFGWGWGSEYEAYLQILADGSVVHNAYGGGAEDRLDPPEFSPEQLKSVVEQLVTVARQTVSLNNADEIARYRERALSDANFRNDEWEKYRKRDLLAAPEVPFGVPFRSNRFGARVLIRVVGSYIMRSEGDLLREWIFDPQGRLIVIRNGQYFVTCEYDAWGRLAALSDGRRIEFSYDARGRVIEARDGKGGRAIYRYNDADELIYCRDTDGNTYEYRYSDRHKLTQILYDDGTSLELNYYPTSLLENLRSIKERDGTRENYAYSVDPHDSKHLKVRVETKPTEGKTYTAVYEYFDRARPGSNDWLARFRLSVGEQMADVSYSDDGRTQQMLRQNTLTRYNFDEFRRVVRAETSDEITEIDYHSLIGQVARWVKRPTKGAEVSINYSYEFVNGYLLKQATKSDGENLLFQRDKFNRLAKIEMSDGWKLSYVYPNDEPSAKATAIHAATADGQTLQVVLKRNGNGNIAEKSGDVSAIDAQLTRISQWITGANYEMNWEGLSYHFQFEQDVCPDCGGSSCGIVAPKLLQQLLSEAEAKNR